MKNIHLIPTNKPSRLFYSNNDPELRLTKYPVLFRTFERSPQYIYITSDEYIGLSWYLDGDLVRKGVVDDKDYWEVRKDYKKIVLTNDPDLFNDGVQEIGVDFLQWFVKNQDCEKVKVEDYCPNDCNGCAEKCKNSFYRIIPKETPKTFKELFANTGIEPTTDESGNIQYNFKATMKEGIDFEKELSKWGYNKGNSIDVEILVNEILPDLFKQFNK